LKDTSQKTATFSNFTRFYTINYKEKTESMNITIYLKAFSSFQGIIHHNDCKYSFGIQQSIHPRGTRPVYKNGSQMKYGTNCVRAREIIIDDQGKLYFLLERNAKYKWCIITDSHLQLPSDKAELNHKDWGTMSVYHYHNYPNLFIHCDNIDTQS
jgi:hypothetical protein